MMLGQNLEISSRAFPTAGQFDGVGKAIPTSTTLHVWSEQ